MNQQKLAAPVGRPRSFDKDTALEQAMIVFWQKGYEGTSIADLTKAMGINPPSLYATFGNKESLFRKVLHRYEEGPAAYIKDSLQSATAREVAEKRIFGAVEAMSNPEHPWGGLEVQAAVTCGDTAKVIRQELVDARAKSNAELRDRLEQARAQGDLPPTVNASALASYITAVVSGISVQAASGVSREQLLEVAQTAMSVWPS